MKACIQYCIVSVCLLKQSTYKLHFISKSRTNPIQIKGRGILFSTVLHLQKLKLFGWRTDLQGVVWAGGCVRADRCSHSIWISVSAMLPWIGILSLKNILYITPCSQKPGLGQLWWNFVSDSRVAMTETALCWRCTAGSLVSSPNQKGRQGIGETIWSMPSENCLPCRSRSLAGVMSYVWFDAGKS